MKVLMISGDKNLLDPLSSAGKRLALQRAQVDKLDVFVWPQVHSLRSIIKAAYRERYDSVTAQDPFWRGHLAWHVARMTHARLNMQVHTDLQAESWIRRTWAYMQLRHADSVRVVSQGLKRDIEQRVHVPGFVLPVYIDVTRFKNIQRQPHEQKTILWIGRFEPEKDPQRAVKVLRDVRGKGIDAKLVMLGAGSLENKLHQEAAGLPVEFPGWGDTLQYLATADVVLCTSLRESWGASIVEALASGVPVVAPDVGVAREAGATIVEREQAAERVVETLKEGMQGTLLLELPNAEEWAKRWRETLV
jgi:glycosyltransferase involved in cell wall biosynthesis